MNLANMMLLGAESGTNPIMLIILFAVIILVMFVMPIFTRRKQQKEVNETFEKLSVGDEVLTAGGIMGVVVEVKTHESGEKLMVIETGEGENKTTMTLIIQALRLNYTKVKQRQEQLAKEKAQREAAKTGKGENQNELALEEVTPDEAEEASTQDVKAKLND
ncbi:MAG: preprotein translocase subunit YajC [Clostridia bacterium]|nr:preprotein translocase subunit YajC [Clostridia bacterium]